MPAGRRSLTRAAGVLALVLAACGAAASGPPTVNAGEVERLLVQRQKERNPSLRVGGAECPTGIAARAGVSFRCTVDVEDQPAPFTVTLSEVLGRERVRYDFRPLQAVVDVVGTANFLRGQLEGDWRSAAIDCGASRARVVNVGTVIDCTVVKPAATRHIQAIVEDIDGTVRLEER